MKVLVIGRQVMIILLCNFTLHSSFQVTDKTLSGIDARATLACCGTEVIPFQFRLSDYELQRRLRSMTGKIPVENERGLNIVDEHRQRFRDPSTICRSFPPFIQRMIR
jgi:hypothetical protein